jgi:predicted helicase
MDEEKARIVYNLGKDSNDWIIKSAQADLIESGVAEKKIVPILYRPFDIRYTYYTGRSGGFHCRPRPEVMINMLYPNVSIITRRQMLPDKECNYFFCSDGIVSDGIIRSDNRGSESIFPLYIYPDNGKKDLFNHKQENQARHPNISDKILQHIKTSFMKQDKQNVIVTPEEIFYYIYGVLYSNIYRERYAEFLRIDFPRVPFTHDYELFIEIGHLGHRLAEIHLLKSKELEQTFSRFEKSGDKAVKKVVYEAENQRVYINAEQYFSNIDKEIWEYQVGGYQVMQKWLKDRKGRTLTLEEIRHYIKIAKALQLTIQYQQQIDALYSKIEENLLEFS